MKQQTNMPTFSGGQFNTLAQNGTAPELNTALLVSGAGSDLANIKALQGRAKRKMITQTMMLKLIEAVENKGLDGRAKSYWNTYYCQNRVYTASGRLYGKYCKNRFCTLCCSIRKAEIINKYYPEISTWENPYFVTLTIRSIRQVSLSKFLRGMNKAFNKIYAKYKKRNQRNNGLKLMGLRSLECNFNPITRKYNPHFHIIVSSKEGAEVLIEEWLKIWKSEWTNRSAQDMRPANNTTDVLIEIIKYGSKIFTEPDLKAKVQKKGNSKIYIGALENIFNAMNGMRIFERFGFNLNSTGKASVPSKVVRKFVEWEYSLTDHDWTNSHGDKLTNYRPLKELLYLMENRIDTELN